MTATRTQRFQLLLFGVLVVVVVAGLSRFLYTNWTTQVPGANDFLARWSNGCALVWSGANPYSDEATLATQARMYGRPAQGVEDRAAFSYPIYALFYFWPLCATQDYAVASAIWLALMLAGILLGTVVMQRVVGWRPRGLLLATTLLWTIFNYPHFRAVILGQMATVAFVWVGFTLLALQGRRDRLGGVLLALTLLKPQLVFLLVPWLLWWAANRRRWGVWQGFLGAAIVQSVIGLIILPTWPLDFIRAVLGYTDVAGASAPYRSLTWMLTRYFVDWGPVVEGAGLLLAAAYLFWEWWRLRHSEGEAFLWATGLTLSLSNFIAFRFATTGYTLLLLPLFQLFALAQARGRSWLIVGVQWGLLIGQWAVFLATRDGDFETVPPHLVLTVPLLIAQLATRRLFVRAAADD